MGFGRQIASARFYRSPDRRNNCRSTYDFSLPAEPWQMLFGEMDRGVLVEWISRIVSRAPRLIALTAGCGGVQPPVLAAAESGRVRWEP